MKTITCTEPINSTVHLYPTGTFSASGSRQFQTLLNIGKDTIDFYQDKEGIMYFYDNGVNGFKFYPFKGKYHIVENNPFTEVVE